MPPDGAAARPRLLFYVQHLLGIGHLHRAARIAKALSRDGFDAKLVLGGPPTPALDAGDADVVRLPPVMAGPGGFSSLVHPDGRAFDAADRDDRARRLHALFDTFAPDVLLIEAFPFGRRQMRFELMPLLDRAKARRDPPLVVASVRDILQRDPRPERADDTADLVRRFFDLVLVHGDPRLATLGASFPAADRFEDRIAYTGLVAPERTADAGGERFAAVVSAGGGAVGGPLLAAAVAARPMTCIADRPWLVLTGPNGAGVDAAASARQPPGLRIETFAPDLGAVLRRAEVSVSQAGYNTVADILVAGCPAVLVPFARGGETEQSDRARLLAARGLATVLHEPDLAPATLAQAIDRAIAAAADQPLPTGTLDLGGCAATVNLLRAALRTRAARRPAS